MNCSNTLTYQGRRTAALRRNIEFLYAIKLDPGFLFQAFSKNINNICYISSLFTYQKQLQKLSRVSRISQLESSKEVVCIVDRVDIIISILLKMAPFFNNILYDVENTKKTLIPFWTPKMNIQLISRKKASVLALYYFLRM